MVIIGITKTKTFIGGVYYEKTSHNRRGCGIERCSPTDIEKLGERRFVESFENFRKSPYLQKRRLRDD